jgi:hypothetical protein
MLIDVACFDESKKKSLFITMLSVVSSFTARNHTQVSIEYDACMNERTRIPRAALNQLAVAVPGVLIINQQNVASPEVTHTCCQLIITQLN